MDQVIKMIIPRVWAIPIPPPDGDGLPLGQIGGEPEEGFGPWGNLGRFMTVNKAAQAFASIISKIIGIMTVIAGIWFFFILLAGAFGYLTAGGDPEKIKSATKRIGNGLTGLIVIILAYAFISLIGRMLGLDILNPQDVIELLGP